jgi:hypothetical protein
MQSSGEDVRPIAHPFINLVQAGSISTGSTVADFHLDNMTVAIGWF